MGRKEFYGYNRPDKGYDSDSYGLDKNYRDQLFGLFDEQYDALKKRLEEEIISYKDMYEGAKSKASALEGRVNVRDVMQALLPILTSIYNEVMDNGDLEDMRRTVQKQMSRLTRQLGKAGVELKYHERGDKFRDGDTISTISVPTWDRSAHGTVKSCYTMGCVIRGEENNPLIEEAEIYEYDRSMRPPVEEKPETVEAVTVENPYEQENPAPVTAENPYEQENPAPITDENPYEQETAAPVTAEKPEEKAPREDGEMDYNAYRVDEEPVKRRVVAIDPEHTMKLRETAKENPEAEAEKKPTPDLEIGATYMKFLKPVCLRSELGSKINIFPAGATFNRQRPKFGAESYIFESALRSREIPKAYYTLYMGDKSCGEAFAISNGSLSYKVKVSGKNGIIFSVWVNQNELCAYSINYTVAKNTEGGN